MQAFRRLRDNHDIRHEFMIPWILKYYGVVDQGVFMRVESTSESYIDALSLFLSHKPPAIADLWTERSFYFNMILNGVSTSKKSGKKSPCEML